VRRFFFGSSWTCLDNFLVHPPPLFLELVSVVSQSNSHRGPPNVVDRPPRLHYFFPTASNAFRHFFLARLRTTPPDPDLLKVVSLECTFLQYRASTPLTLTRFFLLTAPQIFLFHKLPRLEGPSLSVVLATSRPRIRVSPFTASSLPATTSFSHYFPPPIVRIISLQPSSLLFCLLSLDVQYRISQASVYTLVDRIGPFP